MGGTNLVLPGVALLILALVFLPSIGIIISPYEMDQPEIQRKVGLLLIMDALLFLAAGVAFAVSC